MTNAAFCASRLAAVATMFLTVWRGVNGGPVVNGNVVGIFYKNAWYKCLDLPGGDTRNGNKLQLWDCNGSLNQQWIFAPGSWSVRFARNPNKCIDVPGGVLTNGNRMQIWDCNGKDSQAFGYDMDMMTIYLAKSIKAGPDASKCLDLLGGNTNNGNTIDVWDCNGHPNQQWVFSAPHPSQTLLKESYSDSSYENVFRRQCSYDDSGCNNHFSTVKAAGRTALQVQILPGDKTFQKGSPTCPRSELSQDDKSLISPNVDYQITWDWQITEYRDGYWFAFAQLFSSSGPNIFLRWEKFSSGDSGYKLWCEKCSVRETKFNGDITRDMNKWINWSLKFRLSDSGSGYLQLFKDGTKVAEYFGKTGGEPHYFKQGIYTQHSCNVQKTVTLLSNLELVKWNSGTAIVV